MPIPTFVNAGASSGLTGAITPGLPASILVNDILLLFLETANQAISIPTPNGGTWTQMPDSPQGTGTAGGTTATRLTIFWSRYNGTQGAPTTSDSGDHQLGVILAFRGCPPTGNPYDVTSGNIDATSDTSLSATGDTTTVPECLVVVAAALMDDAQNFGATWTNSDLANITVRSNVSTSAGNDGRLGVVTGEKAAAGTYGATTNTLTANSVKGMMTIALKGIPTKGAGSTPFLHHVPSRHPRTFVRHFVPPSIEPFTGSKVPSFFHDEAYQDPTLLFGFFVPPGFEPFTGPLAPAFFHDEAYREPGIFFQHFVPEEAEEISLLTLLGVGDLVG